VVRSDAPYRNFAQLIEYARNRPGQVRIGHPGSGSVGDFCVQLINALTGTELVPIPYAGAAPAIAALRGEHIEGAVLSLGALSAHIKSGVFRGLVSSSRFPAFVDIPTMHELGYREELFGIWFSFLAPAGIPEAAREALAGAIEQAVKAPAITARLAPLGILQSYATPEQTAAEIRAEFKRVGEMARKTGLVK
jgi:tripartite-type tricarboxylate transporter receptor subunit TctC